MWGPCCSCRVPCAATCYRRCVPCGSPCCSYACATLPPSSIPVDPTIWKKNERKKKKKKTKGKKYSLKTLQNMTSSQIALLSKEDLEMMTPSQIALLSPSMQQIIMKTMRDKGISLDKFAEAGLTMPESGYAGSEGGYVTRRCDPRCRSRKNRPATAGCTPREPMTDFRRYNTEATAYCGVGGVHLSDAATATDIKTNVSTSTNNLDFFLCAQKAAKNRTPGNICSYPQCAQNMQQQYNQALQQQYLQKCYYCQVMAHQNPFGLGSTQTTQLQQNVLQGSIPQSQNSFQQSIFPCSSLVSRSLSYPPQQSQISPYYSMASTWPAVGSPQHSAYPSNVLPAGKKCGTCGRICPRK